MILFCSIIFFVSWDWILRSFRRQRKMLVWEMVDWDVWPLALWIPWQRSLYLLMDMDCVMSMEYLRKLSETVTK